MFKVGLRVDLLVTICTDAVSTSVEKGCEMLSLTCSFSIVRTHR